jgi:RNA polymerase sigma-70 factor (ECF subfamily)
MRPLADDELMRRVRDGEVARLGELFERFQGPLMSFFYRLSWDRQLSEDLVQEVFFRILRFRGTFRDGTAFRTWMYQIARNVRVDSFRRRRPESAFDETFQAPPDAAPTPAEAAEANQEEALLRQALQRLSDDQRELLVLTRYQNLKYEHVGELLNCPAATVKTRVFRAMQELKRIYFELSSRPRRAAQGEPGMQEA